MAIPPNAKAFVQPLDPADVLDFAVSLSVASDPTEAAFLLPGENVASFDLALTAEAVAAGLVIKAGSGYPPPAITGALLVFWLAVDPSMRAASIFNGSGITLGIELTATTTSIPPRVKQRTLTVTAANQ